MKSKSIVIVLLASIICLAPCVLADAGEVKEGSGDWWYVPYPEPFDASKIETNLQFIHVEGNRFVDEDGNTRVFQGVNISDPDKLEKNGYWSKAHFQVIKDWGANLVRVPVHPVAWKGRGKAEYFKLLDQAVTWASELGLYLNIEWHGIGNLGTEVFQHPMHYTTRQETYNFWRDVSFRYAGIPAVAFYELFNEPTTYNGQLGQISWSEWKFIVEQMIGIIFAQSKPPTKGMTLVSWATRGSGCLTKPSQGWNSKWMARRSTSRAR